MEFLIRVEDKPSGKDIYQDVERTERGDVIAACPDNQPWMVYELTSPMWRIIKVPGFVPPDANLLDKTEVEVLVVKDKANPNDLPKTAQKRAYKFDIDNPNLSPDLIAYLADDKRKAQSFVTKQADLILVRKSPVADPKVIKG